MVGMADQQQENESGADGGVPEQTDEEGGVIFVLEKASLEAAKVGKTYQILNCDDHANFLRKHKRDPALYRPDILHQALLAILDSPLNKAGRLKGLYVKTDKNVLIQVNPHIRIPRTFKRFCGLMVQLLQKLSIRATNGPDKLLRVVKQPVTRYLPLGARRVGMSFSAPKVVQLKEYVSASATKSNLVFVVGAMAHGKIEADYLDDFVAVSEFPLSAACCIGRICNALELHWNIL
jgi:rRNA small subunit pseudouridine methyltransferase Nep1